MSSESGNVSSLPVDVQRLPPLSESSAEWFPLVGRADNGRRMLIDMAAAKLGMPRAHFLVEAATEKAIAVLQAA